MERGANSSENKSPESGGVIKPQAPEELHSKIRMIGGYQDSNLDFQFGGGGGGGGGMGSGGGNDGGVHKMGVGILSSCGVGEIFSRSRSITTTGTNRQLIDIFSNKSSGIGMAAAGVGFPFTFAQRKELERQAMIYKYMMSSVPVPADLLFPSGAVVDSSASSLRPVGLSKPGDAEPGRCKRTDGKKWRCSRDVAPHQKYCERHLHRGRPRSRKPVEIKTNAENHKKTRTGLVDTPKSSSASQQALAKNNQSHALFNGKTDLTISTIPAYRGTNRESGLIMGRAEQQPWQHLIEASNIGYTNEISSIYSSGGAFFHQDYMEQHPLNLSSYSNFPTPDIEVPTGFIDACSIDNMNNGNVESSFQLNRDSLSPSLDLSIAMALGGSALDQEIVSIHMEGDNEHRIKDSSWLPLAGGGPLAEALHPGSAIPTSPHDSLSTPATTVSSPSGVLHRPMFSHSDGSVCNSPTFTAAPPESAFHRLK